MENLEFQFDKKTAIIVGLFMAGLGSFLLIISIPLILTGGPPFFLILVVFLFFVSCICLTGATAAKLDPNLGKLSKMTRVLFWAKSRSYDLSDFWGIQIREVMIGNIMYNTLSSFYYIQLIGKNKVSLPWVSLHIKQAREKVEQIARVSKLPVDTGSGTP